MTVTSLLARGAHGAKDEADTVADGATREAEMWTEIADVKIGAATTQDTDPRVGRVRGRAPHQGAHANGRARGIALGVGSETRNTGDQKRSPQRRLEIRESGVKTREADSIDASMIPRVRNPRGQAGEEVPETKALARVPTRRTSKSRGANSIGLPRLGARMEISARSATMLRTNHRIRDRRPGGSLRRAPTTGTLTQDLFARRVRVEVPLRAVS